VADDRLHPRAQAFATAASGYERARPAFPAAAVDWLCEHLEIGPATRVLDLAAGTGRLTRPLFERTRQIVAVEPMPEMRDVLGATLPEIEVLDGTAEQIPLADASVGAALGSFVLGYSIDVVSSPLLGVNAFAMSLVFLAVYLGARTIWLHNPLVSALVVLAASLVKSAALVLISAVFLSVDGLWSAALRYVFMEALLAAALAPVVFALLRSGHNYFQRFSAANE
jgi:rod shape-determining protein MreD